MKGLIKGYYKCLHHSVYVRVIKVHYQDSTKIKVKMSFEYKNGMVIEIKNYTLYKDRISHWEYIGAQLGY